MRRLIARRALARINAIRTHEGLESIEVLPVGNKRQAGSCVLANTLPGGQVHGSGIQTERGAYSHSFASRLFIYLFDIGLYPCFNRDGMMNNSESKRRRMCETRVQTVQRKRAEKRDEAAKSVVNQLRKAEELSYSLREQLERALARETENRERFERQLDTEKTISARLEEKLADTRREFSQRITELELDHSPKADSETEESQEMQIA